eukprot:247724-Chlamydomonas_euryale.AAC.2
MEPTGTAKPPCAKGRRGGMMAWAQWGRRAQHNGAYRRGKASLRKGQKEGGYRKGRRASLAWVWTWWGGRARHDGA